MAASQSARGRGSVALWFVALVALVFAWVGFETVWFGPGTVPALGVILLLFGSNILWTDGTTKWKLFAAGLAGLLLAMIKATEVNADLGNVRSAGSIAWFLLGLCLVLLVTKAGQTHTVRPR